YGHIDGLEQAVLPAVFAALLLDGVGDVDAVDPGAGDHGHFTIGALVLTGVLDALDEFEETRAVPVLGRVALETAKVFLGIGLDEIVVANGGVVVDVDDAGVGDDVLNGGARTDIVAVQDGMDAVAIDQVLNGLHIRRITHLLGVFEMRLERPAEDA